VVAGILRSGRGLLKRVSDTVSLLLSLKEEGGNQAGVAGSVEVAINAD